MKTKTKIHFYFHLRFCFHFVFYFLFLFLFSFLFSCLFLFLFPFSFLCMLLFSFLFLFYFFQFLFSNFTMAPLGYHTPPSNHFSRNVVFSFCRSVRLAQNWFILWSNSKPGEGIHKLVQFSVVMEIRRKFHCQVVATHVLTQELKVKEKQELSNLSGVNSPFT